MMIIKQDDEDGIVRASSLKSALSQPKQKYMSTIMTCASSGDQWAAGGTVLYLEIKMKTAGTFKFTKHFATDLIHYKRQSGYIYMPGPGALLQIVNGVE